MKGAKNGLMIALWITASLFTCHISSLNLDLTNYTEYAGPEGSYFGFSVDFYQPANQEVSVIVGAPRDNVGPSQGGSVYICPGTTTRGSCQKLQFDQKDNENITFSDLFFMADKSNQWLGATVRAHNSSILACAPLFHWNVVQGNDEATNTPVGNCQLLNMITKEVANYAPCRGYEVEEMYRRKGGCKA